MINARRDEQQQRGATALCYDELMKKHQCTCTSPLTHAEQPERIGRIWQQVVAEGLDVRCARMPCRLAELEEIEVSLLRVRRLFNTLSFVL